jgi:hypothetical protein
LIHKLLEMHDDILIFYIPRKDDDTALFTLISNKHENETIPAGEASLLEPPHISLQRAMLDCDIDNERLTEIFENELDRN